MPANSARRMDRGRFDLDARHGAVRCWKALGQYQKPIQSVRRVVGETLHMTQTSPYFLRLIQACC